jgi:hypothetical protein
MCGMEIPIGMDPGEANWASGMARELITARTIVLRDKQPAIFTEAMQRALSEALGEDYPVPEALARRVKALIAALSVAGAAAIVAGGEAMEVEDGINMPEGEGADALLKIVAETLARLADEGQWF